MGDNTLNQVTPPAFVQDDDVNQFFTALTGNLSPRNASSGALEDNVHSLGKLTAAWKNLYANNIYINGTLFDPSNVGGDTDNNNAIVSGAVRSTSGQPDFLRASGSGATATLLATTTSLQITANATSVTIESDIALSSLTLAPSTNNTCLVNDTALTDQESSKYTGEEIDQPLTIDNVGTEISDRIGQYICLKTPDGEYMFAYVENATTLSRIYRGFFFDSSGTPVERGTLANNDTLTLMSLGWVFVDKNGTTVDISYRSPIYDADEPGSPVTDDYWYDTVNAVWKRYDGANFQEVDRIPVGLLVLDATNCVASRSFDFTKAYSDKNDISLIVFSNTQVYSTKGRQKISVYGNAFEFYDAPLVWDITTDLETGVTESSSTTYWLYVTETGDLVISDKKYYNRLAQLNGFYHPYNSWRCVGEIFNNGSSNIASVGDIIANVFDFQVFTSSGTWTKPTGAKNFIAIAVGGGGGGGGTDTTPASGGSTGGTSSFGSHCSATGGAGGEDGDYDGEPHGNGGAGGVGSTGDINIRGGSGGYGTRRVNFDGTVTTGVISGAGGNSILGGGAVPVYSKTNSNTNGNAGGNYGGGGSGGPRYVTSSQASAAGGGGGGGASIVHIANADIGLTETVTVGAGGAGSNTSNSDGGAGAGGIVIVIGF